VKSTSSSSAPGPLRGGRKPNVWSTAGLETNRGSSASRCRATQGSAAASCRRGRGPSLPAREFRAPLPREALHETNRVAAARSRSTFPSMVVDVAGFFRAAPRPHLASQVLRLLGDQAKRRGKSTTRPSFAGLTDKRRTRVVVARAPARRTASRSSIALARVIGADGPSSLVIRAIYPDYPKQIPWVFSSARKFHDIIDCPALARLFSISGFHPGLGALHVGAMARADGRQNRRRWLQAWLTISRTKHANVVKYIEREARPVKLHPHTDDEGCGGELRPVADQSLRVSAKATC